MGTWLLPEHRPKWPHSLHTIRDCERRCVSICPGERRLIAVTRLDRERGQRGGEVAQELIHQLEECAAIVYSPPLVDCINEQVDHCIWVEVQTKGRHLIVVMRPCRLENRGVALPPSARRAAHAAPHGCHVWILIQR
eukprot:scaffold44790_cov70-Phaeocystis_antarctica.AAC.3